MPVLSEKPRALRRTDQAIEGARVTSALNNQQTMNDQIVDVIVSEGMVPREKIRDDATIESLGLKSIDLVMILRIA